MTTLVEDANRPHPSGHLHHGSGQRDHDWGPLKFSYQGQSISFKDSPYKGIATAETLDAILAMDRILVGLQVGRGVRLGPIPLSMTFRHSFERPLCFRVSPPFLSCSLPHTLRPSHALPSHALPSHALPSTYSHSPRSAFRTT